MRLKLIQTEIAQIKKESDVQEYLDLKADEKQIREERSTKNSDTHLSKALLEIQKKTTTFESTSTAVQRYNELLVQEQQEIEKAGAHASEASTTPLDLTTQLKSAVPSLEVKNVTVNKKSIYTITCDTGLIVTIKLTPSKHFDYSTFISFQPAINGKGEMKLKYNGTEQDVLIQATQQAAAIATSKQVTGWFEGEKATWDTPNARLKFTVTQKQTTFDGKPVKSAQVTDLAEGRSPLGKALTAIVTITTTDGKETPIPFTLVLKEDQIAGFRCASGSYKEFSTGTQYGSKLFEDILCRASLPTPDALVAHQATSHKKAPAAAGHNFG